jgi:oligopeptide/dipeptide ABC transporter ATP-binding protein
VSEPSTGEAVLTISSLTTEIESEQGTILPVADVSFSVRRGKTLCLVGESGSGKSMLAFSLMRVLPRGARLVGGSVRLGAVELTALSERSMRAVRGHEIAIVPQDPMTAFDPLLTIGVQIVEAIRIHLDVPKRQARARMLDVLEQVRLPNPRRVAASLPSQLSGGMNQRALIAMALATEPVVLLADEPTTALDVTVQAQVLELLEEIQAARGLAIVLITHDMGVAAAVADDVAVMYGGRIVEHGPTRAIFEEPRHPYTVGLIEAARESFAAGSVFRSIPGAPPNLLALPSGCAFEPRCAYARDECRQSVPELRDFGAVDAACILRDPERPWLDARRSKESVGA